MSMAMPVEVELTLILFKGQKHFKLLILGFKFSRNSIPVQSYERLNMDGSKIL